VVRPRRGGKRERERRTVMMRQSGVKRKGKVIQRFYHFYSNFDYLPFLNAVGKCEVKERWG